MTAAGTLASFNEITLPITGIVWFKDSKITLSTSTEVALCDKALLFCVNNNESRINNKKALFKNILWNFIL